MDKPCKYYYALESSDPNAEVVCADNALKQVDYICIGCGARLRLRHGTKRRAHFAHMDGAECGRETYLHKLAKRLIAQTFRKSEHFFVHLPMLGVCNVEDCPVGYPERCRWDVTKAYDLKKYYDSCKEECTFDTWRPDLLIYKSSTGSGDIDIKRDPIFMEIFVTHKSSCEKCASGHRIIEIKIESEEDIEQFIHMSRTYEYCNEQDCQPNSNLVFHNFKYKSIPHWPSESQQQQKFRFWVDPLHGFHFDSSCDGGARLCLTPNSSEVEYSLFRIESSYPIEWAFAFFKLKEYFPELRYCQTCRFYKYNDRYDRKICIVYKKYKLGIFPHPKDAQKCRHYWRDENCSGSLIESQDVMRFHGYRIHTTTVH